jgi:hypothetical protein
MYQQESVTQFSQKEKFPFAGEQFVLRFICICIPQGSGAHKPETKVVVPVVRIVVVPIGRTSVRRRIVPTAAAFHAVRPSNRSPLSNKYISNFF